MSRTTVRSRWPRVVKVATPSGIRFVVDSRRRGFPAGRREFRHTLAEALAIAEQIARTLYNDGVSAFADLSPAQRRDAAQALALLAENHLEGSLLDAARTHVAEKARQKAASTSPTVDAVLDQYLAAKRAETERGEFARSSLEELQSKVRIFRSEFGHLQIVELNEPVIRAWLRQLRYKPCTKRNILTKLTQVLNFARRELKVITVIPTESISVQVKAGLVEILTVPEIARLLTAAENSPYCSEVLPYILVQLFGGLRPTEAALLRWDFIHWDSDQIEIKAATSKTREDRFIRIESTLAKWLLPYRQPLGLIIAPRSRKARLSKITRAAGFNKEHPWPKDVLRHCYGSYWLAVHKDRAHLAELMGNSLQVIKRHYRRAIPESVAIQFWELEPGGNKIVQFA